MERFTAETITTMKSWTTPSLVSPYHRPESALLAAPMAATLMDHP